MKVWKKTLLIGILIFPNAYAVNCPLGCAGYPMMPNSCEVYEVKSSQGDTVCRCPSSNIPGWTTTGNGPWNQCGVGR